MHPGGSDRERLREFHRALTQNARHESSAATGVREPTADKGEGELRAGRLRLASTMLALPVGTVPLVLIQETSTSVDALPGS